MSSGLQVAFILICKDNIYKLYKYDFCYVVNDVLYIFTSMLNLNDIDCIMAKQITKI